VLAVGVPIADARVVSRRADTVVLFARWNWTSCDAVADAVKLLRAARASIAGLVLSRVDMRLQHTFGYSPGRSDYSSVCHTYYRD